MHKLIVIQLVLQKVLDTDRSSDSIGKTFIESEPQWVSVADAGSSLRQLSSCKKKKHQVRSHSAVDMKTRG